MPLDAVFLEPAQAILVSAVASFHTNDDDKDSDTQLIITIQQGNNQFAKTDNILGTFPDHTDSPPLALSVQGTVFKSDLQGATTTLQIRANGNDTWRFNYFLDLVYKDGSHQA